MIENNKETFEALKDYMSEFVYSCAYVYLKSPKELMEMLSTLGCCPIGTSLDFPEIPDWGNDEDAKNKHWYALSFGKKYEDTADNCAINYLHYVNIVFIDDLVVRDNVFLNKLLDNLSKDTKVMYCSDEFEDSTIERLRWNYHLAYSKDIKRKSDGKLIFKGFKMSRDGDSVKYLDDSFYQPSSWMLKRIINPELQRESRGKILLCLDECKYFAQKLMEDFKFNIVVPTKKEVDRCEGYCVYHPETTISSLEDTENVEDIYLAIVDTKPKKDVKYMRKLIDRLPIRACVIHYDVRDNFNHNPHVFNQSVFSNLWFDSSFSWESKINNTDYQRCYYKRVQRYFDIIKDSVEEPLNVVCEYGAPVVCKSTYQVFRKFYTYSSSVYY